MTIQEIKIPNIGDETLEVTEIIVNIGDQIKRDQSILTIEGDKTSIEIPSPYDGVVKDIKVKIGDKVKTDYIIMLISCDKNIKKEDIKPLKDNVSEIFNYNNNIIQQKNITTLSSSICDSNLFDKKTYLEIHASPLIRRLSRKFNIDLKKIKGTGNKKRILKQDVYKYISNAIKYFDNLNNNNNTKYSDISFKEVNNTKEIKISNIQQSTGNNLSKNWNNIPHVTIHDIADITELDNFRKIKNENFIHKNINIKITFLSFILKAVFYTLKKYPIFNSSISHCKKKIILKKYFNIGIAVDTIHGLFVPVIKNVDKKNIIELTQEIVFLSDKANKKKLSIDDMQNGCFTISSLGGIGSRLFNPIINDPEVAILGISKSYINAIWNNKEFVPRLVLPLSLSFNHRIINGAESARFMNYLIKIIEDIRNLLIE